MEEDCLSPEPTQVKTADVWCGGEKKKKKFNGACSGDCSGFPDFTDMLQKTYLTKQLWRKELVFIQKLPFHKKEKENQCLLFQISYYMYRFCTLILRWLFHSFILPIIWPKCMKWHIVPTMDLHCELIQRCKLWPASFCPAVETWRLSVSPLYTKALNANDAANVSWSVVTGPWTKAVFGVRPKCLRL